MPEENYQNPSTTSEQIPVRDVSGRKTVAGVFPNRDRAEQAIEELKREGFGPQQIGIAMRDRTAQGELAKEHGTEAGEGAAIGAVGGGLLGALGGWLVGIGALAIPGIGPVVAGGALASALGIAGGTAAIGAGIGAATGGIVGALIGLGIPEHEARGLEAGFNRGGVLVTVHDPQRSVLAEDILVRYGADIGTGPQHMKPEEQHMAERGGELRPDVVGMTTGAAVGATAGGLVGGPVGAVVGAVVGGAGGGAAGSAAEHSREEKSP